MAVTNELKNAILKEAQPYTEQAKQNRFTCESIEYVTGVISFALNDEQGIRASLSEIREVLIEAEYPTRHYY